MEVVVMASRATVTPKKPVIKDLPLEEKIRQRAHEIYLQRGGEDGSELDDWLQAEDEIRRQQE
jgi:hypothetical protein